MIRTLTLPCADLPAGHTEDIDLEPHTARLVQWLDDHALHPHVFELDDDGMFGVLFDDHAPRGVWGLLTVHPGTGVLIRADWTTDGHDSTHFLPSLVRSAIAQAVSGGTVRP